MNTKKIIYLVFILIFLQFCKNVKEKKYLDELSKEVLDDLIESYYNLKLSYPKDVKDLINFKKVISSEPDSQEYFKRLGNLENIQFKNIDNSTFKIINYDSIYIGKKYDYCDINYSFSKKPRFAYYKNGDIIYSPTIKSIFYLDISEFVNQLNYNKFIERNTNKNLILIKFYKDKIYSLCPDIELSKLDDSSKKRLFILKKALNKLTIKNKLDSIYFLWK